MKALEKQTNAELEATIAALSAQQDEIRDQKRAARDLLNERAVSKRLALWVTAPDGVGGAFTGTYEPQWYDDRDEDVAVEATSTEPTVVDVPAIEGGTS